MNWFNEYLRMNNRNFCNMPCDDSMFPEQMMCGSNPMFMPGQMMDGSDPMFMPGQMMGGSDPRFGFFPFGFFFLPIHHHHHHHHHHRDFDGNREEYNSNAYPYITPYY